MKKTTYKDIATSIAIGAAAGFALSLLSSEENREAAQDEIKKANKKAQKTAKKISRSEFVQEVLPSKIEDAKTAFNELSRMAQKTADFMKRSLDTAEKRTQQYEAKVSQITNQMANDKDFTKKQIDKVKEYLMNEMKEMEDQSAQLVS